MRVAILSKSSADEAALRILVNAILGAPTIAAETLLRSRAWPAVRDNLLPTAKYLHYRTDAEGLVVVVDSNHTYLSRTAEKNRLMEFQALSDKCRAQLAPASGRPALRIAIGVAAPAIEAWGLCGTTLSVSEAAWEAGLDKRQEPYTKLELKRRLYGREHASLTFMTEKLTEAMRGQASNLQRLEAAFPKGFGTLAQELRRWRRIS
jgi:hypothetical protein